MKLNIREFREELGLTQKDLADEIGNSQRNVSNWENGTSEPDCETILLLSETLNVSIDELFGKESVAINNQPLMSVEYSLLKSVRKLTDAQKYALLQFLKEMNA